MVACGRELALSSFFLVAQPSFSLPSLSLGSTARASQGWIREVVHWGVEWT